MYITCTPVIYSCMQRSAWQRSGTEGENCLDVGSWSPIHVLKVWNGRTRGWYKEGKQILYMIKESGMRIVNSNLPLVKLSKATGDVTQEALIHSHKRANKISHRFKVAWVDIASWSNLDWTDVTSMCNLCPQIHANSCDLSCLCVCGFVYNTVKP